MSLSPVVLNCPNSACSQPVNQVGIEFCENCQTPLLYRYLWAVGSDAAQIPAGKIINNRYHVLSPQIWLDTQPDLAPEILPELSEEVLPYLQLYPHKLHIPEVYGISQLAIAEKNTNILLLENAPINSNGNLYPSILEVWSNASAVRQAYWLWQILQLWEPLSELGTVASLFIPENIRIQGWRVRLLELYFDQDSSSQLSVADLGNYWSHWFPSANFQVETQLLELYQKMQLGETTFPSITNQLNQILLDQAAKLYLRLRIVGASDIGPKAAHNEDTCYPVSSDLSPDFSSIDDPLLHHLGIICDGIGGHEGGEVASQLAVQSIKLQVKALLMEVAEQEEIMAPDLVAEQLEAIIRVANNLIAARNDEQNRESRRRMATTLVMALQLPQKIATTNDIANSHELYIANVGDSRAYWITSQSCQQLTIDDDVATREVRLGRSLYHEALQRNDATALTQAIGTRDSEFLRPNVRRFILEEDGLLLLCSDGLSDNNLVEQSWQNYAEPVLTGQLPLESAVEFLIDLANQKNGHDNTSVVMMYCRVSPEHPVPIKPEETNQVNLIPQAVVTDELPEPAIATNVRLEPEEPVIAQEQEEEEELTETEEPEPTSPKRLITVLGTLALLITASATALIAWAILNPSGFTQVRDRIFNSNKPTTPIERAK